MIKVIKAGQKEFTGFCDRCGCEFSYEISDLKLGIGDKIACPTCGKDYFHPTKTKEPILNPYKGLGDLTWPPEPIPTITDPCAGCAWRSELLAKGSYVGDTPCDYCNKNPYKITCSQASVSTADYPKAVYGETTAIGASKTDYKTNQTDSSCQVSGSTYTLQNTCSDDVVNGEVMKTIIGCCEANTVYSPKTGLARPPAPPTSGSNAVKSCNSYSGEHNCGSKKNCKGKR